MAERIIRSGIGTYRAVDGQWTHGTMGEEVDVHEDDLERFDRYNPEEPAEPEATDEAGDEQTVTQADVDAAAELVRAEAQKIADERTALEAEKAEVAKLREQLEAEKAELEKANAAPAKAPAKAPAAKS